MCEAGVNIKVMRSAVELAKFRPITFDPMHNTYREIGGIVGKVFSDG